MSKPIKHRQPASADADIWGRLDVWDGCCWVRGYWDGVRTGEWWRPVDQTPPPEEEKPKRWKGEICPTSRGSICNITAIEVLPGDPPDLDELLEAIDSQDEGDYVDFFDRVIEARHGKGG